MPIDRNSAQYITGAIYKPTQTSAPGVWDLDDQANNIAKNLWPLPPQAVQRSLRFNSADSAYLNRTLVAGNRKTWTWSCWFKPGITADANFRAFLEAFTGSNDVYCSIAYSNGSIYLTQDNGSGGVMVVYTVPVYRDPSAWYHLVVAVDTTNSTSANTVRIYINGVQQSVTGSYPATNLDTWINGAYSHRIGARWAGPNSSSNFNGYMAEVNFVDGYPAGYTQATFAINNISALFGETDPQTGVWIPKRYSGTYGTNGFRLSFANNSSTTALGYDSSGQGNNWTPNNFSITPGVGNDVFVDVPSLYGTDTRLGGEVLGNYCTLNPLSIRRNFTLSNGNLDGINNGSNDGGSTGTLAVPTTGKWYWEMILTGINSGIYLCYTGLVSQPNFPGGSFVNVPGCLLYPRSGNVCFYDNAGNAVCITETAYNGDVYGLAYDADTGLVDFYKNGLKYSGYSVTVTTGINYWPAFFIGNQGPTASINFGQRPFAYPAPTGYKALCTTNLPAPAIGQTSSNQADNHFAAVTYTGNGGTQTISTLDFQPDLVWIKNRTGANSHILVDSIRGVGKGISSEAVTGEYNIPTDFQSFNSNGFTVGYGGTNITNASANNYVAWSWRAATTTVVNTTGTITTNVRANQTSRFSIVRYTGNNGSSQTVGHGLNAIPDMIIVKNLDSSNANWLVYHKSLGSSSKLLLLNTSGIVLNIANYWGSNLPTNSVFGVGDGGGWDNNTNTHRHIAYCWAEVPGYSAFGSYTGNGSSDGPFVYTGFKPRWVMVKATSIEGNWIIWDIARNTTNTMAKMLFPDATAAELDNSSYNNDFLSNGFKVRGTGGAFNTNAAPYIYAAFAETPARLSTAR